MHVRQAEYKDAAQIAHVHVQSWRTTYRNIVSEDFLNKLDVEQRKQMWEAGLLKDDKSFIIYVIEDQGEIVGFINGGSSRNEEFPHEAELYAVYLLEEYQKKGYGTLLYQKLMAFFKAQGYQSMMLWVLKDNPSYNFYKKLGGTDLGEKTIAIGGRELIEVAVGWESLLVK
jgi:ribosomal protein S18 acetylase RimI-like enzyme